jgi:tetratricopeptide (TPR) repeat protein
MMARFRPAPATGLLLVLAVAASGCAAHALRQAKLADDLRDYDVAVANYMKVLRSRPNNLEALQGLERAKLRASDAHLLQGRRLAGQGRTQDAVLELQIAVELNPANTAAEKELRAARARVRAELAAPAEGPTPLEALLARAREFQPAGTELPDVKLPSEIATGAGVTNRTLYQMLARLGNLSVVFDADFQETPAQPALLSGMTLAQALDAVGKATSTFATVTSPGTITVAPDNATKRREYTDDVLGLLVVQNADMKETMDALRTVADMRSIAPVTGLNMITVRDTPERYRAAARLLAAFDKARPQVVVDVEVIEVDRAKLREYSLQIASPGSAGVDGQMDLNREGLTLRDLRSLGTADILTTNIPALYYRLIKTDTRTRTLANPHISMVDGTTGVANFGQDVPVRRTVISPITQGGINIQPQTTFEYRTIGVNISITPRTHPNDEVTLVLGVELSSIAGASVDGPTFGKRNVTTTIRLRDGETNILAGLIRDDERTAREAIPGLGDIPVLGHMFGRTRREVQQTDVVIMLTPRIVRGLAVTEEDLRPFRVPKDGSGGLEGPSLAPPPPPRIGGGGGVPPPALESFPVTAGLPQGLLPAAPLAFPPPPGKVIKN